MLNTENLFKEKQIHRVFEIGIILKGLHSIIEIIGGMLALFISKAFIISTVLTLTQEKLIENPKDFIANYLITTADNISVSAKYFIAFYLISHGIIKLFLVIGLLRKKLWAYPTSVVVFSLFIIYQLYLLSQNYSLGLILLTILDLIIIILTIHEYRYMKVRGMFK